MRCTFWLMIQAEANSSDGLHRVQGTVFHHCVITIGALQLPSRKLSDRWPSSHEGSIRPDGRTLSHRKSVVLIRDIAVSQKGGAARPWFRLHAHGDASSLALHPQSTGSIPGLVPTFAVSPASLSPHSRLSSPPGGLGFVSTLSPYRAAPALSATSSPPGLARTCVPVVIVDRSARRYCFSIIPGRPS